MSWLRPASSWNGSDTLGKYGERAAAAYLRGEGYRILSRNYRCNLGEIDIIASCAETIVLAEVKTRTSTLDTLDVDVSQLVTPHQWKRIARVGRYISDRPEAEGRPIRLDLIVVTPSPTDRHKRIITHATSAYPLFN